ncbi:MAG: TetR/AcrR family transcriptional regulator [Leptospiraceae bacterium]|nr:TetR/AcrR family transcriptional regulator [Leptospiraceae bacterium]MDW8307217.1 TetR/AcrR family transcriptional regulator [Leptospiraceae bacterium]
MEKKLPRQRHAELTRTRLLRSAFHEFARYGYSGARMEAIARKARTNKAMLHYYFGSKSELYQTVLEHAFAFRDLDEFAEEFLKWKLTIPQQLYVVLEVLTGLHLERDIPEEKDFYRLMAWENAEDHSKLRYFTEKFIAPRLALLEEIIRKGNEQGIFAVKHTWLFVYGLISRVLFYAMQRELYRGTYLYNKIYGSVSQETFLEYFTESVFREVSPPDKPLAVPTLPDAIANLVKERIQMLRRSQFSFLRE